MVVKKTLEAFFSHHIDLQKPLLLAYSGGSDSTALYHFLLHFKKKMAFSLHLAHIDHGWRQESAEEAEKLRRLAEEEGIVFHSIRLESQEKKDELTARNKRYAFFQTIYRQIGAQSLVFAHHANDNLETFLKRIFEGAHYLHLSPMKKVSLYEEMVIWRPLIELPKQEILQYLKTHRLSFIDDPTNRDLSNLRSRMRSSLIPSLSEAFGKNIEPNILRLCEQLGEMTLYFEKKLGKIFEKREKGPFGVFFDFSICTLEDIEKRWILISLFKEYKKVLPHLHLKKILEWLHGYQANKQIRYKDFTLYVDRQKVFLLIKPFPTISTVSLKEGREAFSWGEIQMKRRGEPLSSQIEWKNFWKGKLRFSLPAEEGFFLRAHFPLPPALKERWQREKIPFFVRKNAFHLFRWDTLYLDLIAQKNNGLEKGEFEVEIVFH